MKMQNKTGYIPKWNQEVFDTIRECLEETRGKIENRTDMVRILMGSRSKRLVKSGYHKTFSTYGLLNGYKRFYLKAVVELLKKENIKDLASYIVLIGEKGNERNISILIEFLGNEEANIRRLTCSALGKIGSSTAERPLIGMLFDSKPQVRQYAINALGRVGTTYSLPILKMISNSKKDKDYNIEAARQAILCISRRMNKT